MPDSLPPVTQSASQRWSRRLSAAPDAITAFGCLIVWIAPAALGADAVKTVLLMLLVEFILIHATGFFTAIAAPTGRRMQRIGMLLGLSLIYLLFIGVWAWVFHAWWPVTVFLWLLVGKMAWIFSNRRGGANDTNLQMQAWAFSMVAYIGSVFAGLLLPLPELGLNAGVVANLHIPVTGAWVDHPQKAIGACVLYYAALAVFKASGMRFPVQQIPGT